MFYVWFDAPIDYIAATQEWADARPGRPRLARLVVAGGRRPLHPVPRQGQRAVPHRELPGDALGSGEPWKIVDVIKGFNWLTYEGGKFSTSAARHLHRRGAGGVAGRLLALVADRQRAGERRHRLHASRRFAADVNKDLADVFGNFVNRIAALHRTGFDGRVPAGRRAGRARARSWRPRSTQRVARLRGHHEALEFRRAAAETRAIWARANAYLQEARHGRRSSPTRAQRGGRHAHRAQSRAPVGGRWPGASFQRSQKRCSRRSAMGLKSRLGLSTRGAISCSTSGPGDRSASSARWSQRSALTTSRVCPAGSPATPRQRARVRIPKFARTRGTFFCELRNRKGH